MKALVKAYQKPGLWLQEVPIPTINDNEVLIKIVKTAICGTDMHIYNWDEWSQKTIPTPMHIGHEFVGVVEKKGALVPENIKIGARVSGEGHITCSACRNCKAGKQHLCPNTKGIGVNIPGAFAEYLVMPASNIFNIPDFISDELASIFDPLGNAVHTTLSFDCVGEDVLVTGSGPIGIMCAAIAKHIGARNVVITDINDNRLEIASKFAGVYPVNVLKESAASIPEKLGMVEGFDIGLEASGNEQALNDMIELMLNGGKISLIGLYKGNVNVDLNTLIFKGIETKGIYGREMYETWYKMAALIETGLDISPIITHRFHYTEFEKAFDTINQGNAGKAILDWS